MSYPSRNNVTAYAADARKAARTDRPHVPQQRVGKKTKAAIEAMVFLGLSRKAAADHASMSDEALRQALLKPWNLQFLNELMEVLRTSARPKALNKVIDLMDAEKLSPRVALDAAKYIDGMDRTVHQQGAQNVNVNVGVKVETPGYVIDLSSFPARGADGGQQIEHLPPHGAKPLPPFEDVPEDD